MNPAERTSAIHSKAYDLPIRCATVAVDGNEGRVGNVVICAKDDILTPPYFSRELVRAIPGAELVELERGGHCASPGTRPPRREGC